MNFHKTLMYFGLCAFFGLISLTATSEAAKQQADADNYRAGDSPFYGRSDGLFFDKASKTPALIGNGDGISLMGPTYTADLSVFADGQGCFAESVSIPGDAGWKIATGANTACDTTCGSHACVAGLDGTDFIVCSGATADACLCQLTGLDLYGVCGTAWEDDALGVSLLHIGNDLKLAAVSLLAQDIGVDMDADGLDIAGDQTADDGFEILAGMYGATGRPLFPGVDPAFKFCATVKNEDISGTDEMWVGFRDITAPNATFNSYNSYAVIGVDATAGDVKTETEDDGGGTTTTDVTTTALADGVATELCVLVGDTGAVTYTAGGGAVADAVAYTFDNGEPVIPFVHFLHDTALSDEIIVSKWEVSFTE